MTLADEFDLGQLRLSVGEGRRLELAVVLPAVSFGGERYALHPACTAVTLDLSRMHGSGFALRLRFQAGLRGPCQRCLETAVPVVAVDAREVDQPGGGEELDSPYVNAQVLDLANWSRDALVLALPTQLLCRADCAGLCPVCGENLNHAAEGHDHPRRPDPRWAKLSELDLRSR